MPKETNPQLSKKPPVFGLQSNILELLFERMPMGVAILDRQFRIQRFNPTWGDFALRYAPMTGVTLASGIGYFEHLPGSETLILPLFERVLSGETIQENNIRLESGGIVTYWNIVLAPLTENTDIVGILNIAVDVTEQVKLRQNLEQRIDSRTKELQVLLDISATANGSLNITEMLQKILDLVVALVHASRVGVMLLDDQMGKLVPYMLRPEQVIQPDDLSTMLNLCQSTLENGETLYIAPDFERGLREPGALIPIQTRESRFGILVIIGPAGGEFNDGEMTLFQSISDQLAVAIENERLFEQVKQAAVTDERNRLARDLHDAVTQTLFSASMIADVLPRIWKRNPEEGHRLLDELKQLTRGALSEMRTLLVELRPAALADTDLGDLIGHQVNAFIARSRLKIQYERNCLHNPPIEIKEAFYRITQEAFNNITKHAEANQVIVNLDCLQDLAELRIEDDGIGFDSHQPSVEGLGLGIMRERASKVGVQLEIFSHVHGGTRLHLTWQNPNQEREYD